MQLKVPRNKDLRTGWPDGRRLTVRIVQSTNFVRISTLKEFDMLESAPDNKFGALLRNGQFFITCSYKKYPKVIEQLTKYLEDIIFNLMETQEAKDASTNSGKRGKSKRGRNSTSNPAGNNAKNKGGKSKSLFSGLLPGKRGNEQTESDRRGTETDSVAPESSGNTGDGN